MQKTISSDGQKRFFTKYGATTLIKMFTSSFYQTGSEIIARDIRYPNI